MKNHLDKLRQTHRNLNRAVDTMRAPARQDDAKRLKKLRLLVKDRIAAANSPKLRA